jgi:hypothetical protein
MNLTVPLKVVYTPWNSSAILLQFGFALNWAEKLVKN